MAGRLYQADAGMQIIGKHAIPDNRIPIRAVGNDGANHALPGTPQADFVQGSVKSKVVSLVLSRIVVWCEFD